RVTAQPRASRDGGGRAAAGRRRHVHHDLQRPLHWILAGEGGLCGASPRCHPLPEMKPLNNGPGVFETRRATFPPVRVLPRLLLALKGNSDPAIDSIGPFQNPRAIIPSALDDKATLATIGPSTVAKAMGQTPRAS